MAEQPRHSEPTEPIKPPQQRIIVTEQARTMGQPVAPAHGGDRFPPGTLLAGRYRIVGRLGKGGMGEVYRADDLKLGQPVALKFLPPNSVGDPKWLRRLTDEVRIARDVAHPNVCRTYDIVEADGEHFIAMEFVDGEDLSSLLRRIGRLPQDKAIEIARQLCAGLAAAHDKGVLHRDLKPANVMLDGRGRVRITDFGIAALAEEIKGQDVQSGTPAYMSPEQLAGEGVSVRSDIYTLGLVMYEVFTGKEAKNAGAGVSTRHSRDSGTFTSPSTLVQDLDPLVERVIMRCLEQDPRERPSSAIAVAAALPGGDPLAMALAAGETPSPEMIAQSGQSGGMRPAYAMAVLGGLLVMLVVSVVMNQRLNLYAYAPSPKPPEVLLDRVREIMKSLGYVDAPGDEALWSQVDWNYLNHVNRTDESAERWERLRTGPSAHHFAYRSTPRALVPQNPEGAIRWSEPAFGEVGMARLLVDSQGRLRYLDAVPSESASDEVSAQSQPAANWSSLIAAAGFEPSQLVSAAPSKTPPVYCDERAAWTGRWGSSGEDFQIDAGSFRGRVNYFEIRNPWDMTTDESAGESLAERVGLILFLTMFIGVFAAACVMALRNLRAGRSDRRGAARLAVVITIVSMLEWVFEAHHPPSPDAAFAVMQAFSRSLGYGLSCWLLYVAVEPYARRYWPHSLISWSRLLSGRFRDPLVGRDALLGCFVGVLLVLASQTAQWYPGLFGQPPPQPLTPGLPTLGGRAGISALLSAHSSIGLFIGFFVMLLLLRIVLRRQWLAVIVMYLAICTLVTNIFTGHPSSWIGPMVEMLLLMFVMVRLGLFALLVCTVTGPVLWNLPSTFDLSQWWAAAGMWGPVAVFVLAGFGFWIALAGQPLFRDEFAQART